MYVIQPLGIRKYVYEKYKAFIDFKLASAITSNNTIITFI